MMLRLSLIVLFVLLAFGNTVALWQSFHGVQRTLYSLRCLQVAGLAYDLLLLGALLWPVTACTALARLGGFEISVTVSTPVFHSERKHHDAC